MNGGLRLYLQRQASSIWRYVVEQSLYLLLGWVPTIIGMGLRGVFYRLILTMNGWAAIENGVRLRFADRIRLGNGVYLDMGVYLHACPNGIEIGENTIIMHGAILHVYNFRDILQACDFIIFTSAYSITINEDVLKVRQYNKPMMILADIKKEEKVDQQTLRNGAWLQSKEYDVLYKIFTPLRLFTSVDKNYMKYHLSN